ncbi:MAG: YraN family protein [Clostridia bacterium]|nr:YraN family protein [Clostridia bacterium]
MNKREVWTRGEVTAKRYLEEKGYRTLAENYAAKQGEIDLVMQDGDTIVFVEVKARETIAYGEPIEAVTPQKVRRIALTAQQFLLQKRLLGRAVRFDVVEVLYGEVRHTENAFSMNDAAKYLKY